jgi:hypothetical protein
MIRKIFILTIALVLFTGLSLVSAFADEGAHTHTGILADILCVDSGFAADGADMANNPENHTVMCALMKPCIASGYTLLVKNSSGSFDSFPLDAKGNKMAVKYLKKTKNKDNILVDIKGTEKGNMIQVESIMDAM